MVIENIAHIVCSCGEKIQVLNEDGTDWDEQQTAELYYLHLSECENNK